MTFRMRTVPIQQSLEHQHEPPDPYHPSHSIQTSISVSDAENPPRQFPAFSHHRADWFHQFHQHDDDELAFKRRRGGIRFGKRSTISCLSILFASLSLVWMMYWALVVSLLSVSKPQPIMARNLTESHHHSSMINHHSHGLEWTLQQGKLNAATSVSIPTSISVGWGTRSGDTSTSMDQRADDAEATKAPSIGRTSRAAPKTESTTDATHTTTGRVTSTKAQATEIMTTNILHVGQFGLGHRLSKLSSAIHLGFSLNAQLRRRVVAAANRTTAQGASRTSSSSPYIHAVEVYWGTCGIKASDFKQPPPVDIFTFLFGGSAYNPWPLEDESSEIPSNLNHTADSGGTTTTSPAITERSTSRHRTILIRNDVLGYYAGQNYKNAQSVLPPHYYHSYSFDDDDNNDNNEEKENGSHLSYYDNTTDATVVSVSGTAAESSSTSSHRPQKKDLNKRSPPPSFLPSPWLDDKMPADARFYERLLQRFSFLSEQHAFQRLHNWTIVETYTKERKDPDKEETEKEAFTPTPTSTTTQQPPTTTPSPYVIGLHLRAGNGEQDHFTGAQRGISDRDAVNFVPRLCRLLHGYISHHVSTPPTTSETTRNTSTNSTNHYTAHIARSVLIFVATDTPSLIPELQECMVPPSIRLSPLLLHQRTTNITILVYPQPRVALHQGVSYAKWTKGDDCYQGWKSSMMDMALLAQADVVIAAMRSTFTQILPMSLVFARNHPHEGDSDFNFDSHQVNYRRRRRHNQLPLPPLRFCEVAPTASHMLCFRDRRTWLFRKTVGERDYRAMTATITVNGTSTSTTTISATANSMKNGTSGDWYGDPQKDGDMSGHLDNGRTSVTARHETAADLSVDHKVMVHFPEIIQHDSDDSKEEDPRRKQLVEWLLLEASSVIKEGDGTAKSADLNNNSNNTTRTETTKTTIHQQRQHQGKEEDYLVFAYGQRLNRKYRGKQFTHFRTEWTLRNNSDRKA